MDAVKGIEKWFDIPLIFVLNVLLIPSLYIAIKIGRPRFFGLALYVVLGVLLFNIFYGFTFWWPLQTRQSDITHSTYILDWRVVVSALCIAIAVLGLFGQGFILYLSLTVVFVLLLLRVHIGKTNTNHLRTNLLLITGTSLTLIASQLFTVTYYADTTDTILHSAIVARLAETGTLAEFATTRFWGFLVFHTLSAIGVQLTDVGARTLIAIVTAVLFQVALVAIVLAVRYWIGPLKLALTAGILVGFNASFLEWASKAHYQSLSFVFFAITILAITIQFRDKRMAILSTIVSVAWIATHHLSLAMALFLTAFPIASATLLYWFRGRVWPRLIQYGTFIVTFLVYWTLVTNEIVHPISWIFIHSPAASVGLPSAQLYIQLYDSFVELLRASIPIFLSYVHHAFWLAVSMLGLLYFLRDPQIEVDEQLVALSGFAIAAVFYFPNPLWIPLRGLATLLRWDIMALPLLIFIPAYGIWNIFTRINIASIRGGVTIAVMFLLIFTTIGVGMTSPSLSELAGYDRKDQEYLSQQDLDAVSFTRSNAIPNQQIYGSSSTAAHAFFQEWKDDPSTKNTRYQRVQVSGPDGRVMIESGLTVFQVSAYRDNAIQVRFLADSKYYEDPVFLNASVTDEEVDWSPMSANIVYSNRATVVQHDQSVD